MVNETRSAEIRGIVQDVLADSQSRTSLQDGGAMAGYKAGRGFFLSSQDGSYTMNITGQLQARWVMSHVGDDGGGPSATTNTNKNEWGFQVRRAKVRFQGNVVDKTWHYHINGSFVGNDGQAGAFNFQEAVIGHDMENMTVKFGQFKTPWNREELVSSENQLAVERSLVNEYFNADRMVGVGIEMKNDAWRLNAAYGNGFRTAYNLDYTNTNSSNNPTKWSAAARFQYKLSGDWSDFDSFTSSMDSDEAMMFGVCRWSVLNGEFAGVLSDSATVMGLTADFSMKMAGMSIFASVIYQNYSSNIEGIDSVNPWGFVGQVGYSVTEQWELFGRFSWANNRGLSGPGANPSLAEAKLSLLTVGANYFINDNVKFTGLRLQPERSARRCLGPAALHRLASDQRVGRVRRPRSAQLLF